MTLLDRVMSKVAVGDDVNCWEWLGSKQPSGYGQITDWTTGKQRTLYAHHVVYEEFHGPRTPGHHIHHTCGNPGCVSPFHLEELTVEDHQKVSPDSHANKTHCPQGHPYDEENTYVKPSTGARECRTCARERMRRRRRPVRDEESGCSRTGGPQSELEKESD